MSLINISNRLFLFRSILLLIAFVAVFQQIYAQNKNEYYLSGIVRDSLTLEPLPFSSITVADNATGALANDQGIFELTVPDDATMLIVNCLGYDRKEVPITKGRVNLYDVQLSPSSTMLKEVVVRRKKYSKKNNPAVDFVNALRKSASLTDPLRNDFYNYNKHEIITIALNDFVKKDENSKLYKSFPFLWEHVDTSEISGKPILNLLVKEKTSDVHYSKELQSTKENVTGLRNDGIDEITDQGSMKTFLEDVLREINLYDNDIVILQNRFVSPLSRIAPDFYKFYLTDTVDVGNEKCIVLSFYPHNQAAFGFNGQVFVPVNDSTMFIKKVTMRTPRNINLNFIENLYISQEFDRAPDGSRLKKHDDMTIEASILPGKPAFYVRRNVAYDNHNFDTPTNANIFRNLASEIIADAAYDRDSVFWSEARMLSVTDNEKNVGNLMTRLRKVPVYYWTEKVLKVFFSGYVPFGKKCPIEYGPVNTTISSNSIEGFRFRLGGLTNINFSKRWFSRFYGAYGTRDHKFKYGVELEYSFHDKKQHSREFPVHSLRLSSLYDLDFVGQHYLFTNQDNFVLSLKRLPNTNVTYHQVNKIDYTLELHNNFSVKATVENQRQFATKWIDFVDGYGNNYPHFTENSFTIQLRYAPGEKFYQSRSYRVPINLDAPVFMLTHTIAPKGWLNSKFQVNKTELSFQKRFWFSAFGYLDVILKGGHVWSKSAFIDLMIPNTNLSYTIQPESFALMNPMEFINDSYASCDLTYWLNGALLNNIPLVKKLKLREVVSFKGLWGNLSKRNDPAYNRDLFVFPGIADVTKMSNTPYMEVSAGLDNIFKIMRLDYVWRLSYLNVPYKIDRRGLRIALHVTF